MEKIIKQIKEGAKHTRLSTAEKAVMKTALLRHMHANPVRVGVLTSRPSIPSPFSILGLRSKKGLSLAVMGGLLMSSSVSFAAESSVPGDVLFPVKVHVNESVRGAVAVSPTAKAAWEIRLVERRLEEVEKLAVNPLALPDAQQMAQQNLVSYTQNVKNRIEQFEDDEDSEGAINTASNLSVVLNAHEQILTSIASTQNPQIVAGTFSTTTPSVAVNNTATVINSIAPIVSASPVVVATHDDRSLQGILGKVREARGNAEEKRKELQHKYHPEEDVMNTSEIDTEEEPISVEMKIETREVLKPHRAPAPARIRSSKGMMGTTTIGTSSTTTVMNNITSTTSVNTVNGSTTTNSITGVKTAEGGSKIKEKPVEKKDEKKKRETEVRSSQEGSRTSSVNTPAPRTTETHRESVTETHRE